MSATTVDYCIAVDQATGGNTTSKASAYLTADNFGSGEGSVKDNVLDNLYPAARFVFAVNGVVIYDLLYGV
ncbi:MAG: hypothetical protein LRS43_04975, partial [Desulfurococcales archaeon]|nr:hypothetical protein [Desulfurococcales archaeon]